MPKLIRFLAFYAAIGFALALTVVTLLLTLNVVGLRTLIMASDLKWLATVALVFLMTITFGSVVMGIAVMLLPYSDDDDDDDTPRGKREYTGMSQLQPASQPTKPS
ncbi:MAG: hypothetical protein CMK06_12115 [Ponticaulis sp.]|nr:hypothetical protein [Ponticaulis sp.]